MNSLNVFNLRGLLAAMVFPLSFVMTSSLAKEGATEPSLEKITLAGTWSFRLDAGDVGVKEKWFEKTFDDTVQLPGTTDENHKGIKKDEQCADRLSRVWYWKGPAWYQRKVTIPESWKGKRITLLLERTKNTRVWVDQACCGSEDTLSALQIFDLTRALTPGEHTLTVLIDNAKLPPVGPAHAVDERTQTNWNGIIGKLELRATAPIWIEDVQVYPDAAKKQARVRVVVGNVTGQPATGKLVVQCRSTNIPKPAAFATQSVEIQVPDARNVVEFVHQPGGEVPLWDEFQPALLRLEIQLMANAGGQSFADGHAVSFGLRDFKRDGQRLAINGRTVFLRGRLDCANYPLTGYPPMDVDAWRRILGILKAWGLNHVRFHSWCPPEAAFVAADELGMYFQVELPNKRSSFKAPESTEAPKRNIDYIDVPADPNASLYDYALREGELIFRHFGNHPSFVMFALGNELGRNPAMYELVARFKQRDPRHLFAQGSNNNHWQPSYAEGDDFWVTGKTGKTLPTRGSFFPGDMNGGGQIYREPPATLFNYRDSIKDVPVPVIGHEMAEFAMTPDFREIPKYTGVLKARNLEIFQQRLKDANMLDLAHDFLRASGALAAICQRADFEAALRTPGFAGFHWLDIQDFPGQGTALVGMLNDFMENKGITTPEEWRQFCSETVPLLLMSKYTWTSDETFTAEIKVAHYGPADIPNAHINWGLYDDASSLLVERSGFGPLTIKEGRLSTIGTICFRLPRIKTPQKIKLAIQIEGTPYKNQYDLWVYPPKVDTCIPKNVLVTNCLDGATLQFLTAGGKVLLFSPTNDVKHSIGGAFPTDFWCWAMFSKGAIAQGLEPAPGTQGFICDPKHPALAEFPTEFHSNWQWWQIVKKSRPIILDKTPADYRPIIHVIDNFARNHKLGLLFEAKVSNGKLIVCASDLPALQHYPEARQLFYSLLRYVDSPAFAPKMEINPELLKELLSN
jgi:hypothetical protein